MESDQKVILKFLLNKRVDARDIANKLQTHLGENIYALRTIRFWIAEIMIDRQDLHHEISARRPLLDDIAAKILAVLAISPFESTRSVAERLPVVHPTVLLHLHVFR
jgi:hypothetical protein